MLPPWRFLAGVPAALLVLVTQAEPALLSQLRLPALALALAAAWAWRDGPGGHALPGRVSPPSPALRLSAPLALGLAVVAVCAPSLRGDFLGDDFGYVRLFHDLPLGAALRPGDISHGIWGHPLDELRPVFALSFKLGLALHGPAAWGFHLTSVLLHAANSVLVYALVRRLAPGRLRTALVAGALFGVMPVHAEPIAWVTGKVDSLPTFFYLAVVLLFVRYRLCRDRRAYAAAVTLYALGVFSKEILITLPVWLVAYDVLLAPAPDAPAPGRAARLAALARVHAPFVLTAAGFLAMRRLVFTSFAREGRVDPARLRQFLDQQGEKLRWLLLPGEAWNARMGASGFPWGEAAEVLVVGLLLGAGYALVRRSSEHRPALALTGLFGGVWYALTLAPLVVTYASPRHLYLPSCGVAIALAVLVFPPTGAGGVRTSAPRLAAAVTLVALHAAGLRAAQAEWLDAGEMSRRLRAQIDAATEHIAPGGILILSDIPAVQPRLLAWKFALPFALQPPFVSRDLYAAYSIIEPHELYSRPLAQWWPLKQALLTRALAGADDERVELSALRWSARRGEIVVRHARLERGRLRAEVSKALGAAPQDVSDIDARRARRLLAALKQIAGAGVP